MHHDIGTDFQRTVWSSLSKIRYGEYETYGELALRQTFLSMPLYTMVRFNMWDEILAEPEPEDDTAFLKGIWNYARGRAFAGQGKLKQP